MLPRPFRLATLLMVAGSLPYVWFNDPLRSATRNSWGRAQGLFAQRTQAASLLELNDPGPVPHAEAGGVHAKPVVPKLAGGPVEDLREVLRFDVQPQWVSQRWSRVSTVRSELQTEGLRVPLVTGTGVDALAGSLTYYFDKQWQLRRIHFHGYTGDAQLLTQVVTEDFAMRPEPTLDAGLYLARWNGRPTSMLRISRAPVVRASQPHAQLEVELEINRPDVGFGLSPHLLEQLESARHIQRW